jgi:hypothetical protein
MSIFISRLYSSVNQQKYRWAHTIISAPPYICRFSLKTDEYKFIFVGFGTGEYNLNIFVGTDEFKNPDE